MSSDGERPFRLRPPRPRKPSCGGETTTWSIAFKRVLHYARMSRNSSRSSSSKGRCASGGSPRSQRCAVRVTYARNGTNGLWRAHGRYLAREGASREEQSKTAGFDQREGCIDISRRLGEWQASGDERIWKVIVSPEFGERIDLDRLTRDLMGRMGQDLGTALEWAAVAHFNTEHPHVHIALRGRRDNGQPLHLDRNYIRQGLRNIVEDYCTRQLGHRTSLDAEASERREIAATRFTSLDREILRMRPSAADEGSPWSQVVIPAPTGAGQHRLRSRLAVLSRMGLAESEGPATWRVQNDLEAQLRAMQRTGDRQRVLHAHGALMSDERLPIEALDLQRFDSIEGRVLLHTEDELTGSVYMMVEGTDAKVHVIPHTAEIDEARSRGLLRPNSFVKLQRLKGAAKPLVDVVDLGDSELLLKRLHISDTARQLLKRGVMPTEDGWGGWLGRYQKAIRVTAERLQEQQRQDVERQSERRRGPSLGRA